MMMDDGMGWSGWSVMEWNGVEGWSCEWSG